MKKVLSLVLVLTLVLGSFSFAFGFNDIVGEDCEDAVQTLVALDVINGYLDGTFRPEKTITRAELAKMLVVTLGYADLATPGTTSSFNDTAGHWADPSIALASGQKIVNGYPNGSFRPDAAVSYDEAITMIVRALGYTDDSLNGTWPTNYKVKAVDLEITKDVNMNSNGADRGGVAMLLNNALDCDTVYVNNDGDIIKHTDGDETVKLIDKVGEKTTITVTPEVLDEDDKAYVESKVDLSSYMYEKVNAYKNDDDEVVYVSDTKTATIEGTYKGLNDDEDKIKVKVSDKKTEEIDLARVTGAAIFFNGATAIDDKDEITKIDEDAKIKLVFPKYNDKPDTSEDCVGIVVDELTDIVFVEDEFDTDYPESFNGITIPTEENDDDEEVVDNSKLTVEGAVTSLEDIEEDDVINVYSDKDSIDEDHDALRLVVTRDSVEGKATKLKDSGEKAVIDGTTYDVNTDKVTVELGDEGIFFFDENGDIVAKDSEASRLTDYAMVIGTDSGKESDGFNDTEAPRIKLFTDEGDEIIYDFKLHEDDGSYDAVGDATFTISGEDINVSGIADNALVKYKVNSKDEISNIEVISTTTYATAKVEDDMLNGTVDYDFVSKTIIFNLKDGDYSIVDYEDINENVTDVRFVLAEDSLSKLEVVILTDDAGIGESNNYASITSVADVIDENGDSVKEITVLLNGKKVTYLTDSDNDIDVTTDTLVKLTINSDDIVTAVGSAAADASGEVTDVDTSMNRVELDDSQVIKLADNCAVYVYDESDDEVTIKSMVHIRKNKGYTLQAFDSDSDQAGYEAVIVVRP